MMVLIILNIKIHIRKKKVGAALVHSRLPNKQFGTHFWSSLFSSPLSFLLSFLFPLALLPQEAGTKEQSSRNRVRVDPEKLIILSPSTLRNLRLFTKVVVLFFPEKSLLFMFTIFNQLQWIFPSNSGLYPSFLKGVFADITRQILMSFATQSSFPQNTNSSRKAFLHLYPPLTFPEQAWHLENWKRLLKNQKEGFMAFKYR